MAFRDDLKKYRESQGKQATTPTKITQASTSGSSGSGGSDGSFRDALKRYREKQATVSLEGWVTATNALLEDSQRYFGSWRSKDDDGYNSLIERNTTLLAQADSWRKQYAGNDEAISYIDSVVEALSNVRQGSRNYLDYYGQWDSEDSYKKWMQHSTPEGRQEQYEKNKARLEELQKQQRDSRFSQAPGLNPMSPYLSGGSAASGSPYAASQQDPKVGQSDIEKEIDQIRKEILLYERGGTDETGFYYGFKAADDYGKLKSNADYGAKSANRKFQNASREELNKADALNYSSSWYTDADGVYRDAFGNELETDASGNWVNPGAQGYAVVDRLGLYLSASEEEKQEAVSVPVSMEGTWESVIKDGYDGNWELLTKDETDIYYYLLNTSGQETADKYLSDMKVELNRRNAQNSTIRYTEAFDEANALERLAMSIATTPAQLFSGAAGFVEDTAMTLMGKDINPYSAAHGGMHYSNIVRSEQAKAFDDATGGIAIPFIDFTVGDLYQAGMSAFDMAVGGRLGAGAYEALMGMGAASSEAKRLYEQGASNSQIAWGGALAGAAEMVFEHASIENLINMKDADTVGQWIKNILIQGGIEASEEGFTEIANTITNAIVMGDESDWAKLLVEHDGDYLAALIAKAQEVGNAAFSGFVSGSVGGGAQSTASYAQTQAQNKELGQYISGANSTDALLALAQEMAGVASEKDQKRLTSQSDRLQKEFRTEGGKHRAAGRLYNTVRSVVTEQNISEISSALQEKGFSKKDATAIAGAVAVQASGMELTDKQQKTLQKYESNETVQGVLDEVLGNEESGINQRAKSIAKFEFDTMRSHIASQIEQAVASQENAETDDTMDTLEEEGAEGSYEASADGKTILKSNSKIVNIQEVADIRDGKMTLKLDDGSTVDAEDVIYGSEGEALVYETIAQMGASVRAANILVNGFKASQGMDARVYAQGIEEAFRYGKQGIPASKLATSVFASKLNPGQQEYVYRQGQKAAGKQVAKEQATVLKNRTVAEKAGKDSRSYQATLEDGISAFSLNESQKASYRMADQIAKAAKVNIRVYAGKTGEHGYYDPKTDEIYLNLNATNKSGKSMMAFTLSHELVHRAKKGSPAKYKAFANFLMEQYGKQDSDIDAMIGEELAAAKRFKVNMTYDQAFEEVVCDACQRMLLDTDAGQKLAEFGAQSKQNKSFLEDLKRWITEFLEKIRSIFEGVEPDSMAAKEFAKFDESVKQILADMYVDMTIDAGENLSVIHAVIQENAQPISSDEIITDGAVVTDGSELKYSLKSMKADIAEGQMFEDLKTFCGWTQKQVNELKKNLQDLVEYMTPFRDILDMNETYGREGRRFSPYKPNIDPLYKISMDFSTLCSKRLLTQYVIENLQLRENRPMSAEEQMAIRHMLNEYRKVEKGLQVACAMCYVEAARLKSPKQIQKWMDDPSTAMRNYFADKNPEFAAYIKEKQSDFKESRGYARNATKKDMSAKDVRELNKIRPRLRSQYQVSAEEAKIIERAKALPNSTYLTAANLANLSETEPTIYSAYAAFVRTATRSKSLETDEPYYYGDSRRDNGNGIVVTDDFIEAVNRENGMRFSSWSDWRIQHMLDYITAVIDNSVRGAAMHGYTKFGEEVRVLGKTGMMFNMSGVAGTQTGLNEDGTLSFSPTESIDVNEAIQLREEFPDTAGLQCIGVGDDHIVALLRSDIIDYVIPYHISGLNAALRRMANIQGWQDYTSTQHAAIDKSVKLENAVDKEHWHEEPVYSEFFVGYDTGMTGIEAMIASADRYVQMCKDRGLKPKFEQFLGEENYWKLLIDRKMINQKTGKLIKQRAVTPTFDFGTIKEVVDQHVQNYDSNLEARALNHIVENWDSIPKHIKDLKSTKAKKSVDTLANQTLAAQPADDQKVYSLPKGEPAPTFYSHMARVVDGVKQEKLGAASVVSMLRGKGVKVEEIKWSGIEAFLEGKKSVTKAELQEFIAGSMLQIVEEQSSASSVALRYKGNDTYKLYDAEGNVLDTFIYNEFMGGYISEKTDEIYSYTYEIEDAVREEYGSQSLPRWADYKLDGGSNYRELVFRLPNNSYSNQAMRIHWGDDAEGVLAHARIQDFDVNGKKMLFIEEIQSDYHNEGHESGYADSKTEAKIDALKAAADERYFALEDYSTEMTGMAGEWDTVERTVKGARLLLEYREAQDAYDDAMNEFVKKIPDAPFKDTYHEYVMKRLLREAAEKGYDSIGWTPSEIQVKRWSEEFAEGYRIEYDQDIPKFMNKYGKKWGAKVEKIKLNAGNNEVHSEAAEMRRRNIAGWRRDLALAETDSEREFIQSQIDFERTELASIIDSGDTVWSMPITDSMKESVLTEGQPLYSLPKNPYSYEALVSKPDMVVTTVDGNAPKDRAELVRMAKQNAAMVGKIDPKSGSVSVYVKDIGRDVGIGRDGLKHSLDGGRISVNAPILVKVGEILSNSIRINELTPREDKINESYVLIGAARNADNELYVVRSVVNRFTHKLVSVDALYAVNAKKEPAALLPLSAGKPALGTDSTITIAELLDYVNQYFPDILPEEVLKHYGHDSRPKGKLGEDALYKLPVGEDTSPRALLANALESVAQNDMEKRKLQEYKSKISLINAEEKKLRSLTRQIQKENDPKKVRELQFEAMHTTNRINTYDRQLLRLEASKPLQDVLTREKKMAFDRGVQKGKDALEAYRKRTEEKQQEIIDRYQESRKRGVENRQKTAMRQKIRKVIRDLDKILNRGDKKKNVKEDMKDFVADALATAEVLFMDNYRNEDMVWYGVSTDMTPEETKLMSEARAIMEEISNLPTGYEGWQARQEKEEKLKSRLNYRMAKLRDVFVRERARLNKMQVSEVLGNLADSYAKLQTSEYAHIQGAYQEAVYQYLLMLKDDVGGTVVKDMSIGQLEELYKAYTMVMTTVRNANRMFAENLNNTRDTLANMVMYEVHKAGGEHGLWTKAGDKINTFSWNNEKPVYAFERIGSNTFTKLFNNIRKGQDSWAVDLQEANNFRRTIYEKYNHSTWDMDKQYKFTSSSGIDFELNLEQIMSLYAYSKRAQAHDHLLKGGFVFDGNTEVVVTKNGIKRTYLNKTATAYNVSFEILEGIISKLTAEQKSFVDEMQDYLSTTMGEKGNEISMEIYGVKLFNEKFYFPLRSAGQYMEKAKEADLKKEQGQISIVNSGFAKATKVKASNPVVLAGFMDVWADHVNEMSMYHSFVLPMEDFRRVYNYSSPHMEGQPSASVNGVIQNAYGAAATDYIDKLYRDLNGGAITDNTTGVINKLMNLFKKGAVFASASVVVQQPSAIARAIALVDTKYFIGPKVDAKRHKALWAEMKQYAPVVIIKEMGYFDTNMGKSAVDYLTGEEYSGIKEKAIALVKDESYRDELLSKAPSLADELTWCAIWEAVKRETKDRNKNMDVRSEEFLRLAGERFSEVIDKTQVYDSVLARSANMRSKDTGMKMATAFMSEPTTSINMVADALRKGKKGNKQYARRAIGSVVASVILNSFLVAFVQAARDDDEGESITEKYLSAFVSGIADGVNPATYIPFIKDIVSIVQGYDVERSDMAVISDLWNAYQNLGKDSVSAWRKVEGFAGSIAQIFGLPLKNIMRDLRSLYQAYDTIVNGEKTTMGGIKYAVKEAITGKSTSKVNQLYESKVAGDEAHAARVEARYDDEDSANAALREAIKKRFLEGELDTFNAQRELVLYARMDAGDVRWLMDRWEYIKEHGSDEGYSKYNDFYEAVETGKNLKAVIKEYNDSGTDMKTLKSLITKHFKPIYMEMTTSERASIKGYLLNAYEQCGDEREYAEWMLESFVWESQGHGEVSVAAVRDYYSYCADAGVPRDVYLHIREFSNNTENDVDENGKTINYSAVKKVMAEIHSLSITNEQKNAIALTLWKESTVKKYKLW